jgi:DNA gyrase/topoisomerase IV subunit A
MRSGDLGQKLLMNSSAGLGFVCKLGDLVTKTRQGKDFMKVDDGARARPPALVLDSFVAALSSDARLLVFPLDEVPERPNGGVGVQLLALPDSCWRCPTRKRWRQSSRRTGSPSWFPASGGKTAPPRRSIRSRSPSTRASARSEASSPTSASSPIV